MDLQELKTKVCDAGKMLLKEGLVARTWGNVSIKVNDTQMVITPSGRKYDELTPNEMVLVDVYTCLLYTSPSPRDRTRSRMPSSA